MDKNSSFLVAPDCLLVLWMALVLYSFHRKQNLGYLQLWSKGLLLIVVEDVARIFYLTRTPALVHSITHVCALAAYYFAGLAFFWTACGNLRLAPHFRRYLTIYSLPHVLLLTAYGMGFKYQPLFVALSVTGFVASVTTVLWLRYPRIHLLCQAALWGPSICLAVAGDFRSVTYYTLFGAYAATAMGFYRTLPHKRWGRTIVIFGFGTWSLCFLIHPLTKDALLYWAPLVNHIWDVERFVVTTGLLILALEELSAAHEYNALHDTLTGLANRRLFSDRLSQALARAERAGTRLALITIDLNGFKQVNDKWGHVSGDHVLREVSSRLRTVTRASDTLCRLGGDEFCLLIEDLDSTHALSAASFHTLAGNLMTEIRQRVECDPLPAMVGIPKGDAMLHPSLSIGIAVFPEDARTEESLIRLADQRMYENKAELKSLLEVL